jgi:hypothetical protein
MRPPFPDVRNGTYRQENRWSTLITGFDVWYDAGLWHLGRRGDVYYISSGPNGGAPPVKGWTPAIESTAVNRSEAHKVKAPGPSVGYFSIFGGSRVVRVSARPVKCCRWPTIAESDVTRQLMHLETLPYM